jgi:hypothetical protein
MYRRLAGLDLIKKYFYYLLLKVIAPHLRVAWNKSQKKENNFRGKICLRVSFCFSRSGQQLLPLATAPNQAWWRSGSFLFFGILGEVCSGRTHFKGKVRLGVWLCYILHLSDFYNGRLRPVF